MASDLAVYTPASSQYDLSERQQQQQYHQAFDFSYHASADPLAPLPDEFESDLDALAGLEDINFELLTVENNNALQFLRSDNLTCGPPSTLTASSESTYDSLSTHSESVYSFSPHSISQYSFPLDFEMDFQRIAVDPFASAHAQTINGMDSVDPTTAFNNSLSPTPPRSPVNRGQVTAKPYVPRSSFSDYGPTRSSMSNDYYNQLANYGVTMSPAPVTSQLPVVPSIPLVPSEEFKGDPRKKYRCNVCPRAFARAYNLKTHLATHDPDRPKPHVCPHRACGRSFSRKHDLGRHLISIHRDGSVCSSTHSASSKKSIGVDKGRRNWCDNCGKSSVGGRISCECGNQVK
ncbi:hypothetical protein DFH05DRAFT_1385340 [Lentinula detonsa]|uniref:C2H2-type domain-containing protein n=1 Tax=Lentinula detonsa TaxID=2804962 RepID=A0A9W8PA40_9AGAR|nr:hypothetical protein DFH05DRAFT_1385340 [Lentinula detonsa]KAJ3984308.1 hypothetical protein F5890DRAFT_56473 [Lentinula detonsa]